VKEEETMFSLEPSDEQRMIAETAEAFAAGQMRKIALECDEKREIPEALLNSAWELGLVSAVVPEEYGGAGMERSAVTGCLMLEELAYGDASMAMAMMAPALFTYPIITCGTEEQKKKYLPLLNEATPAKLTAAVMEPGIEPDLSELKCVAKKSGSGYVITGKKCFVPLGGSAEKFLVYAAIDGKPGYENVGAFIVEKGAKGLTVSEREQNMGLLALETVSLDLAEVEVDMDAVVGGDQGIDFAQLTSYSRVALNAMAIGLARAANEYARDYAKERHAFGEPIAHKQAIAFMVTDGYMEIEAARLLNLEAAWRLDQGLDSFKESYLAKLVADETVLKCTDDAVQTLGGHGYIREHPCAMWLCNARGFTTFEGMAIV
jgi:alkylation response protein AidB-like acyl-CoA dehydrogenase